MACVQDIYARTHNCIHVNKVAAASFMNNLRILSVPTIYGLKGVPFFRFVGSFRPQSYCGGHISSNAVEIAIHQTHKDVLSPNMDSDS